MNVNIIISDLLEGEDRPEILQQKQKHLLTFLNHPEIEKIHCLILHQSEENDWLFEADVLEKIADFIQQRPEDVTVFYGDYEGMYLGSSVSVSLRKNCHTDVTGVEKWEEGWKIKKRIFSAHMDGYFSLKKGEVVILSPMASFSTENENRIPSIDRTDRTLTKQGKNQTKQIERRKKENRSNLSSAEIVLIGGKGLKTRENFQKLVCLAEKMGVEWGCSRAVALSGWAPYERVVGISGETLHGETCVTFGVSGAAPLVAGLEGIQKLIAVNTDKKAPIFSYADYGIEGDAIALIEELL